MKVKEKTFKDFCGVKLRVKSNRSNIEIYGSDSNEIIFSLVDSEDILIYIYNEARKIWKDFKPKEAFSIGSDYDEFYDKQTDNNGYLTLKQQALVFYRDYLQGKTNLAYRFNKAKCQSFVYDVEQLFPELKRYHIQDNAVENKTLGR